MSSNRDKWVVVYLSDTALRVGAEAVEKVVLGDDGDLTDGIGD